MEIWYLVITGSQDFADLCLFLTFIPTHMLLSNSIQAAEHLVSGKWLVGGRAEKGKTGRRKGFCQHQSGFSIYGAKILGFRFLFVCISVNVALGVSCD